MVSALTSFVGATRFVDTRQERISLPHSCQGLTAKSTHCVFTIWALQNVPGSLRVSLNSRPERKSQMRTKYWACAILIVLFSAYGISQGATVIYDDGNTHEHGLWTQYADITIQDGSQGNATTVNLVAANGDYGVLRGTLIAYGISTATVSHGATIDGPIITRDKSSFSLRTGGSVHDYIYAHDSSHVDVSAGEVSEWIQAFESAHVSISDGKIDYGVSGAGNSILTISGGHFGCGLSLHDHAWASVYGGSFAETFGDPDLDLHDSSKVSIFGSGFTIDGNGVAYGDITTHFGTLTGKLRGTSLQGQPIDYDFSLPNGCVLTLVPEPATISLLALGGLAMLKRRHR